MTQATKPPLTTCPVIYKSFSNGLLPKKPQFLHLPGKFSFNFDRHPPSVRGTSIDVIYCTVSQTAIWGIECFRAKIKNCLRQQATTNSQHFSANNGIHKLVEGPMLCTFTSKSFHQENYKSGGRNTRQWNAVSVRKDPWKRWVMCHSDGII